MTLSLPFKLSFEINSFMLSQMTTLPNFGTPKRIQPKHFYNIIFHIFDQNALITDTTVDKNKLLFNQPIDIDKPLDVYIKNQEICQSFAANTHIPIFPKIIVCTGTKHTAPTGLFNLACKIWKPLHNEEHP